MERPPEHVLGLAMQQQCRLRRSRRLAKRVHPTALGTLFRGRGHPRRRPPCQSRSLHALHFSAGPGETAQPGSGRRLRLARSQVTRRAHSLTRAKVPRGISSFKQNKQRVCGIEVANPFGEGARETATPPTPDHDPLEQRNKAHAVAVVARAACLGGTVRCKAFAFLRAHRRLTDRQCR